MGIRKLKSKLKFISLLCLISSVLSCSDSHESLGIDLEKNESQLIQYDGFYYFQSYKTVERYKIVYFFPNGACLMINYLEEDAFDDYYDMDWSESVYYEHEDVVGHYQIIDSTLEWRIWKSQSSPRDAYEQYEARILDDQTIELKQIVLVTTYSGQREIAIVDSSMSFYPTLTQPDGDKFNY